MGTARLRFAAMTAALLMGAASSAPLRAEPVHIRLAWIAPGTNWGSLWLEKKDLARHYGASYVLEPVHYVGTPQMVTALAAGELEVANLAYSTVPIAIENAGLSDLRIIADELQDGVKDYYSQEYMVLNDGGIKQVEDLRGKVVHTFVTGAAVDIAIRAMLRRHGLEPNRDYTLVEAPPPSTRAMLAEKKVALSPAVLPFARDPELRRIAHALFTQREVTGVTQLLMWTARKSFIDQNRAAMVDFMEDTLRITRWFLNPANHAAAIEITGRVAKQPPERFDWLFTKGDYYHDPDMFPDLAALQKNVELAKEMGFVQGQIDVRQYADLSLIQEAARR
jgi:NitT/TauT family transport system substrate-binding protein